VESKFTEWLTPRSKRQAPFKPKYFPVGDGLWRLRRLDGCQALAEALQGRSCSYRYLNVPQLLKHALGLATDSVGHFSLLYLYYDVPGPAAETHRAEIVDFANRLGQELSFRALTYQELFARIQAMSGPQHTEYLGYLRSRYFPVPD
jgi:hypothetical protein